MGLAQSNNAPVPTRVLAFDIHDTLARWPAGRVRPIEVQRLLARFGIEISYQAYEAARQGVLFFDACKRPVLGWTDFLALLFARMGAGVSIDLLTSLTAMYEARDNMEVFPDVVEALDAARRAGLVTCAFSTLPQFMLGRDAHPIVSRLDHYFDGAVLGVAKGHPEFYRGIIRRLGVAPDEILAVGDDPVCDVELPMEAGWRAVLLDRRGARRTTGPSPFATISSLGELMDVVRRIGG